MYLPVKLFSGISKIAWVNIWILVFKMFFFSAYFVISGTQNVPAHIYEFAHHQYSHDERSKRRRQLTLDECAVIIETPGESASVSEVVGTIPRKIFLAVSFFFQSLHSLSSALNQTFKNSLADLLSQLHYRSYLENGKLLI